MKSKHVITIARSGAIYVPKLTTKHLGVFGWAWVAVAIEEKYITMRFYKESIAPKMDEFTVKLRKKSGGRQAMTGGCIKFAEAIKDDFGDANYLDLHIKTMLFDEESLRISLDRPSKKDQESTPEREEKAKADEKIASKDAQAEVCQETNLGTVSKPTEKQLDIWNITRNSNSASVQKPRPRTRPLPDGLPEWLHGPLSRGEQVRAIFKNSLERGTGWVIGAYMAPTLGNDSPDECAAIMLIDGKNDLCDEPITIFCDILKPFFPNLKSAAECLAIAKALKIGLSPMQIEAIINGGVPPEGHSLPDEMFE
jgi:hypothetical protein